MQYLRKKSDWKYVIPEKPVEENEGRLNRKYRFRKKKKSKASARKRDGRKSENKNRK